MLRYVKGAAPKCLTSLSAAPQASWGDVHGDQRDEIRAGLIRDQAGLCAYCQRRIRVEGTMKIEHWAARSRGGPHFQWTNLLGTCDGIAPGAPPRKYGEPPEPRFHCDTERGNATMFLHPVVGQNELKAIKLKPGTLAPEHAEFLRYYLERWLHKQPGNA